MSVISHTHDKSLAHPISTSAEQATTAHGGSVWMTWRMFLNRKVGTINYHHPHAMVGRNKIYHKSHVPRSTLPSPTSQLRLWTRVCSGNNAEGSATGTNKLCFNNHSSYRPSRRGKSATAPAQTHQSGTKSPPRPYPSLSSRPGPVPRGRSQTSSVSH